MSTTTRQIPCTCDANADSVDTCQRHGVAAHTPGPWDYTESSGYVWGEDEDTKVCMISFIPKQRDAMDANARLIAAAPEMLEALANINTLLTNAPDAATLGAAVEQAITISRAAIQKARG